jgi:hypothetical protein
MLIDICDLARDLMTEKVFLGYGVEVRPKSQGGVASWGSRRIGIANVASN